MNPETIADLAVWLKKQTSEYLITAYDSVRVGAKTFPETDYQVAQNKALGLIARELNTRPSLET